MLIPVFTVFATHLQGATPALIGLALGSYGLSQGILQMPMGMLSDRFGRKPILTMGLLFFICGSLIGALSHSIYTMILARALQGAGAIGSVLIALLADLTPDEQRTKAMAVIGMTIGLSFSLAMVISPALTNHFGLAGIFYLTTALALLALFFVHAVIPSPRRECFHIDSEVDSSLLKRVILNKHLQRLNFGIFFQHFILTATFYVIPMLLQQQVRQGNLTEQWYFYLPLMLFSFVLMIPFILIAEKRQKMKLVFLLSVLLISLAQLFLVIASGYWLVFCGLMFLYFIAFNILEAILPSLVSKQSGPTTKGTAMGIYSTSQFLGIFAGGSAAGLLYQLAGNKGVFFCNALISLIWLVIASFMKPEVYLSTLIVNYPPTVENETTLIEQLKTLVGIKDVFIAREEKVIYLRIDRYTYQPGSVEKILNQSL
ncbi:transporter, major facilitator family [Legionella maceachernii]|uniref:Transporter, major facilitator family n=2 Tax=Legionellaceae TaxID=444 RepID=A0A0W0W449_9GAMM|nr:transporter, major facilitator family [Legionella maceachernii]SKA02714.1 Predicted arabinose efflux permease, MFS family [Legionella maceachernii]SUP00122.1 Inner membrane transport protein yajR [Legionella maceachernii]